MAAAPGEPDQDTLNSLLQQPDEPAQRSLFGEILDWMLAPLLLLWPASIVITYLVAKSIANQPFDRGLEDKVLVLAQQVRQHDGQMHISLPPVAKDILRADDADHIYFQVRNQKGELLEGDAQFPAFSEEEKPLAGGIQFRNFSLNGTEMRSAYTLMEPVQKNRQMPVLIEVAETLEKRGLLANEIIKGVVLPQFVILPVALALVWFALTRGLSPVTELQKRIHARRPDDLSPVDTSQVPEEITPLVESMNEMLQRVEQSIAVQKSFIADAAHQMKTPLAGMRMQSELALRQDDPEEIRRSLQQLAKSSEAATRLINQLLTLAKAENREAAGQIRESLLLNDFVLDIVSDWLPAASQKNIDLGYEQCDSQLTLFASPVMLREVISNLIDNAIRYTPAGRSVTVRLDLDSQQALAILEVEDEGPGIPEAHREKVFQRFYRILGSNTQGSGLGLAIVREIVQQHGGTISIRDHHPGAIPPGCIFRIVFPINPFNELQYDER